MIGEPPPTFAHVIVDEAQDLTPMQLRMIARRARDGALTILGDVAQGTGPVSYTSWNEVLERLPGGERAEVEELRHAYRVPREIMDLALPLLDTIAPDIAPPIAYRTGTAAPRFVEAKDVLAAAYREAAELPDGLLAVIAPEELIDEAASDDLWDGVPLLSPREAKGLEFDHVVVVEPALIAAQDQGLRRSLRRADATYEVPDSGSCAAAAARVAGSLRDHRALIGCGYRARR